MPKIYFITWASGVWKTFLISSLKEKYKNKKDWIFLHFDSIGIPSTEEMVKKFWSVENWQKETTYKWIKEILSEYKNKKTVIFEWQVNLEFIKNWFKKNNFSDYKIVLIDCKEEIMIDRLINWRNQKELANEDMKNWLQFLRKKANDLWIDIIDSSDVSKEEFTKCFEKVLKD